MGIFNRKKNANSPKINSEKVKDYYESWTDKYLDGFGDIFQAKQTDNPDDLANYYIKQMELSDGKKLVDAGCGVAGPAIMLSKKVNISIDALTISPTQVKIAQAKILEEKLTDRLHIYEQDFHIMSTLLEPGKYDVVYFMESLVHSSRPELAIQEAYKLLKPDGILYIKDLFEKTPYTESELPQIKKWVNHNNQNLQLNIIMKEKLLLILRDLGFQLEFCQLMRIPTNQDLGNAFVAKYDIMPDPISNSLPPYLEWYEIKALKPGPGLINKM